MTKDYLQLLINIIITLHFLCLYTAFELMIFINSTIYSKTHDNNVPEEVITQMP